MSMVAQRDIAMRFHQTTFFKMSIERASSPLICFHLLLRACIDTHLNTQGIQCLGKLHPEDYLYTYSRMLSLRNCSPVWKHAAPRCNPVRLVVMGNIFAIRRKVLPVGVGMLRVSCCVRLVGFLARL